jgi:antitoxin ParD1/3/4
MNVSLTPELDNWVHGRVKEGFYNSASEVVRESLRLLKERESQREILLKELRAELRLGAGQIEAGLGEEFTGRTVERIKAAGRKKLGK